MAYHQFTNEDTGETFGSFQIFWIEDCEPDLTGWHWAACFPAAELRPFGCLPDSEPNGPFATYEQALDDALRF